MARLLKSSYDSSWGSLYPFDSHTLDLAGGEYHYVDEPTPDSSPDETPTLLFVHSNPTWSFHGRIRVCRWPVFGHWVVEDATVEVGGWLERSRTVGTVGTVGVGS